LVITKHCADRRLSFPQIALSTVGDERTAKAIGYLIANEIAPSITFFFDKIAYPDGYHFCLSYQNGYLNGYHFFRCF
jgi:hypothetical protein